MRSSASQVITRHGRVRSDRATAIKRLGDRTHPLKRYHGSPGRRSYTSVVRGAASGAIVRGRSSSHWLVPGGIARRRRKALARVGTLAASSANYCTKSTDRARVASTGLMKGVGRRSARICLGVDWVMKDCCSRFWQARMAVMTPGLKMPSIVPLQ
jgi:hypothetical protein